MNLFRDIYRNNPKFTGYDSISKLLISWLHFRIKNRIGDSNLIVIILSGCLGKKLFYDFMILYNSHLYPIKQVPVTGSHLTHDLFN